MALDVISGTDPFDRNLSLRLDGIYEIDKYSGIYLSQYSNLHFMEIRATITGLCVYIIVKPSYV